MLSLRRLLCCGLLLFASLAQAQDANKPPVVFAVSGADKLLTAVDHLTGAVGQPDSGRMVSLLSGPYLAGIDRTKPAGGWVTFSNGVAQPVGFLAVRDIKAVLALLKDSLGDPREIDANTWEYDSLAIRQRGSWTYVAMNVDALKTLPEDPTKLLGNLHEKYDLAVRVDPPLIPADMRASIIKQAEENAKNTPRSEDPNYKLGQDFAMGVAKSLINESQAILLGLKVDPTQKRTTLDVHVLASPNTPFASALSKTYSGLPPMHGFDLPEADSYLRRTITSTELDKSLLNLIGTDMQKSIKDRLATLPPEEAAKEAGGDVILKQILDAIAGAEQIDQVSLSYQVGDKPKSVLGLTIAKNTDVEAIIKKAVDFLGKKSPDQKPVLKLDVAKVGQVRIHELLFDVLDEELQAVFGKTGNVYVGSAPGRVYFAIGEGSILKLKEVLASTPPTAAPPEFFTLRMAMAGALENSARNPGSPLAAIGGRLAQFKGKDKLLLNSKVIDRRLAIKLEVEDGAIGAIGETVKMMLGGR